MRQGKLLGDDYFDRGAFRNALPGEVFSTYTCYDCTTRFKTFASFRAHRREMQGECKNPGARPGWLEQQRAA